MEPSLLFWVVLWCKGLTFIREEERKDRKSATSALVQFQFIRFYYTLIELTAREEKREKVHYVSLQIPYVILAYIILSCFRLLS